MSKLSIITINFNNLEGLKKTAESVINQTWKDFEWIIIDGGSTDGSKEYIVNLNDNLNHSGWNPITYWCSEQDKGIYNAMNKGIAKASGEYLNFMNSGDCFYESNSLEKVLPYLKNQDADIVVGKAKKFPIGHPTQETLARTILLDTLGCHQATFIKADLNQKYPYDESLKIVSDWKFFVLAYHNEKLSIRFIDSLLAVMEPNGISTIPETHAEQIVERKKVIEELYGKEVVDLIIEYKKLVKNEFILPITRLLQNDLFLYRLLRRCIRIIMMLYNVRHRNAK